MLRPALISFVYLVCWVALDALSSIFKVVPNVTVWSPQEGLSLVLLFVFGLRYWPVLLLNTPLHAYFVFEGAFPVWEVAIFDVTKTITYAGAAVLLVRRIKIDRSLGHQRDVIWFVGVACLAAPLFVA